MAQVQEVYDAIVEGRQAAYKPGGMGIKDPRDSLVKVLEVWGIFDRLKHVVQTEREVTAALTKAWSEPGTYGNRTHITYEQTGTLPIEVLRHMHGMNGEMPGAHRNKHGKEWDDFVADVKANGITNPIFIMVDPGMRLSDIRIAEGNHRRDAALELGLTEAPVAIRYFGHAERDFMFKEGVLKQAALLYSEDHCQTKTAATEHIRKALENEILPQCARDGDCLPVAGQVRGALARAGIESDVVLVMGWLGENLLGFGHAAVLVDDSDTIVDATATQYDANLPSLIITSVEAYKDMLAKATGVERVTIQAKGRTAAGPSWRSIGTQPIWTWHEAVILTSVAGRSRSFEVYVGGMQVATRPSLVEAKAHVDNEYGPQQWKRESLPLVEVLTTAWGLTDEFTDPLTYYYVDFIERRSQGSTVDSRIFEESA
jgi:hypothetical protein